MLAIPDEPNVTLEDVDPDNVPVEATEEQKKEQDDEGRSAVKAQARGQHRRPKDDDD